MSDSIVQTGLFLLRVVEIAVPLALICEGTWLMLTAARRAMKAWK